MTREEAIKVLSQKPMIAPSKSNKQKMFEEATDMAIEALSADEETSTFNKETSTLGEKHQLSQVVRCKDCIHQEFYFNDTESFCCHKTGIVNMHMEDGDGEFFCKYGERR